MPPVFLAERQQITEYDPWGALTDRKWLTWIPVNALFYVPVPLTQHHAEVAGITLRPAAVLTADCGVPLAPRPRMALGSATLSGISGAGHGR